MAQKCWFQASAFNVQQAEYLNLDTDTGTTGMGSIDQPLLLHDLLVVITLDQDA